MDKRIWLGAAVSAVAICAASAAAAQSATDNVWAGPYVGMNIGGSWNNSSLRASLSPGNGPVTIPPGDIHEALGGPLTTNSSSAGFAIGGEAGYNYQVGHFVLGIETDGGAFDTRQNRSHTFISTVAVNPPGTFPTFTISQSAKTGWQWNLRPRIGYAWGPWLAYVTGGVAVTDVTVSASYADTRVPPNLGNRTFSSTQAGGVVGVGGAWMFAPGWSGKLEWLYSDFGRASNTFPVGNGFANFTSSGQVRANVLRTGVDYKF